MFKLILRKTAKWLLIVALLSLLPVLVLRWTPAPGSMLMVERWINPVLHLTHVFTQENKVECDPCGHCFSRFVLSGKPRD